MRHISRVIRCVVRAGAISLFVLICAAAVRSAPCIAVAPECTEWISVAGQQGRLLVYRSYPLDSRNDGITRAFILIHGGTRDADNSYRSALAAGFLADALGDTVIISPRFASGEGSRDGRDCKDPMAAGEISWVCDLKNPDSWRSGGPAIGNDKLTSFDLMDEILRKLARKAVFPNLKAIVVAGHSAGGQFVTRYQMANQLHETLGVECLRRVSGPAAPHAGCLSGERVRSRLYRPTAGERLRSVCRCAQLPELRQLALRPQPSHGLRSSPER
jgi:pimeloyl-ACP methyl ester carboxylesterase